MKHSVNQALAQKVYTLCYRITACRSASVAIAMEAMSASSPLRQAVRLALQHCCKPDVPQSAQEEALWSLTVEERAALLLLDSMHLPSADAARWAEVPERELLAHAHKARLKLVKNA